MRTHTSIYSMPKAGNQAADNQDAYSLPEAVDGYCDLGEQRFAVSDGATEALYSGPWASMLTLAWTARQLDFGDGCEASLAGLAERWKISLPSVELPWWAEEKIGNGAFATLTALTISEGPDSNGIWSLEAVGDSCMFLIRGNQIAFVGPVEKSADFGASPFLIGSAQVYNAELRQNLHSRSGPLYSCDEIILATDALACWILAKTESGHHPGELFQFLDQEDVGQAFEDFIANARSIGEMRNDDVTFMSIRVL